MASINKLSLRGIRAFSPDDDEQVITFAYPLTIIVGANGCGKTTIIEALKYAVTGALPPGNKSGQAFVHDPKHNGTPIVKAQVKLRFTNRAGTSSILDTLKLTGGQRVIVSSMFLLLTLLDILLDREEHGCCEVHGAHAKKDYHDIQKSRWNTQDNWWSG